MKKKVLFSLILSFLTIASFAQANSQQDEDAIVKSVKTVSYRLFPTQNIWIFLKLNTRNGQIWQVRYSMRDESRFVTFLSLLPLVSKDEEVNDRFTLYPTQNIFTFILLDQLDGRTWQVQWSTNPERRGIIPIE